MSPADLAALCAEHLDEEEKLLLAVLPKLRAAKEAFLQHQPGTIEQTFERHHEMTAAISSINHRRERLRKELAKHHGKSARPMSISAILESLPEPNRISLRAASARVRALAGQLVATIHWLAVHSRIHLDAYQRLLRDLTGTKAASGRYGAGGKPEASEYRPLFDIHG